MTSGPNTGGFIGYLFDFGFISFFNCQNEETVSRVCTSYSHGGFVGLVQNKKNFNIRPSLVIRNCSSHQNIQIDNNSRRFGGIIGTVSNGEGMDLIISDSYTSGFISLFSGSSQSFIGGLIGSRFGNM